MLFINLNCLHERFIGKGQAIYDFYISVEESYGLSNETKCTLTYIYSKLLYLICQKKVLFSFDNILEQVIFSNSVAHAQ